MRERDLFGRNPDTPINTRSSFFQKAIPKSLRIGAIGGILLTASACDFIEKEKKALEEIQAKQAYAERDDRLVRDKQYELGEKVGNAIVMTAGIVLFIAIAKAMEDIEDTDPRWHDPDKGNYRYTPPSFSSSDEKRTAPRNPIFSTKTIKPSLFEGPKTLRDGKVTGHLRNDTIFDRQQTISDNSGRDVGRIEPDAIFQDRQNIKDKSGKKIGSIETDWRGKRVIKDKDSNITGEFEKKPWGETEIKRK